MNFSFLIPFHQFIMIGNPDIALRLHYYKLTLPFKFSFRNWKIYFKAVTAYAVNKLLHILEF